MLIRSQKRDTLIPLETCNGIGIKILSRDIPSRCEINVAMDAECYIVLGEYESHERAQEVLEEIVKYYSLLQRGHVTLGERMDIKHRYLGCFDMPTE